MKKNSIGIGLLIIAFLSFARGARSQQSLWFGTVKSYDKLRQGRFEIFSDGGGAIKTIIYAPYGIRPIEFKDIKQQSDQLTFTWQADDLAYRCRLLKQSSSAYAGTCSCENKQAIELTIREFTKEDALLQGDSLPANQKDMEILDRALALLNNGSSWNRSDNRICDNIPYPYKWSLFCALHQASIEVDNEYRHLRPAIQATRQAIDEITSGKKYAHLLQDYNNEARSFDSIATVLNRAKAIIKERMAIAK